MRVPNSTDEATRETRAYADEGTPKEASKGVLFVVRVPTRDDASVRGPDLLFRPVFVLNPFFVLYLSLATPAEIQATQSSWW